MVCVRRAWLTLNTASIDLENEAGGWYCTSLDLGYPEVRAVVNNRPAQDGVDDQTRYWGSRAITADIVIFKSAGAVIDDVASDFAPFMVPSARPVLHWILDRPGAPERTLTVRAADYGWAVEGDTERNVHLGWIAADPIARDATVRSVTVWAGSSAGSGRTYNLTFPRTYPAGGGGATSLTFTSNGDVPVAPLIRIYGPVTRPRVQINRYLGASYLGSGFVSFLMSFTIDAGHWVDVDCFAHSALLDGKPDQSVIDKVDFANTSWPMLAVAPQNNYVYMTGTSTSGISQAQVIWQDGYLS